MTPFTELAAQRALLHKRAASTSSSADRRRRRPRTLGGSSYGAGRYLGAGARGVLHRAWPDLRRDPARPSAGRGRRHDGSATPSAARPAARRVDPHLDRQPVSGRRLDFSPPDRQLVPPAPRHGSLADFAFRSSSSGSTVTAAIASLAKGQWLPTSGTILQGRPAGFFVLTTAIYAAGTASSASASTTSSCSGCFGIVDPALRLPRLQVLNSRRPGGWKNPRDPVPISIFRSCATPPRATSSRSWRSCSSCPRTDHPASAASSTPGRHGVLGLRRRGGLPAQGHAVRVRLRPDEPEAAWMIISDRIRRR